MSFLQFPSKQYIKVIETSENVDLGTIVPANHYEITNLRLRIYIRDTSLTNEIAQVFLYNNVGLTNLIGSSNQVRLSDVTAETDWLGWVRFDFNRSLVLSSETTYVRFTLSNYTRQPQNYVALALDFLNPVYYIGSDLNTAPIAMEWFGAQI